MFDTNKTCLNSYRLEYPSELFLDCHCEFFKILILHHLHHNGRPYNRDRHFAILFIYNHVAREHKADIFLTLYRFMSRRRIAGAKYYVLLKINTKLLPELLLHIDCRENSETFFLKLIFCSFQHRFKWLVNSFLESIVDHNTTSQIDFFYFSTFKKRALIATMTVLSDMNTAPNAGPSIIPAPASTPAASGMANELYPVAQMRF